LLLDAAMLKRNHTQVRIGRLAPSPTGFLHLGNAWSFWLAWLDVRSVSGRLILRMEDIDPDRAKETFAEAVRNDLTWLGLDWDEEAAPQSRRGQYYAAALEKLRADGLIYPCYCTRKELRSLAGAPHVDDAGAQYPGTCRNLSAEERLALDGSGRKKSLRLLCPAEHCWTFHDRVFGPQSFSLEGCGGDFALRRSDGVYAYQLAVVVDDMASGVNSVVRGRDILVSTPRQLYLYSLLGGKAPACAHLPLILDHQGDRLAKRHASLTLASLREAGIKAETILGYLAFRAGLTDSIGPLGAGDICRGFSLEKISPADLSLPDDPAGFFLKIQKR